MTAKESKAVAWRWDEVLEAISDKIRSGLPVGLHEAIAAINYQEARKAHERANVWWRRAIRRIRQLLASDGGADGDNEGESDER